MAMESMVALAEMWDQEEEERSKCQMCGVGYGDYQWEKSDNGFSDHWCYDCLAYEIFQQAIFFDEIRELV